MPIRAFTQMRKVSVKNRSYISMFTSFCMTGCPFCRNTAVRLGKAKYGAVGTHSGGNSSMVFSLRPDFGALLGAAFPTICMRPLDIGFTQWVRRSTLEDNFRSRVSTISCLWNLEPRTSNLNFSTHLFRDRTDGIVKARLELQRRQSIGAKARHIEKNVFADEDS